MPEITKSKEITGVVIVKPDVHGDNRGRFVETFRQEWLPDGAPTMVQGNRADRKQGALVGLHYHRFQADFWYVPTGRAMVVLHDLRESSPTDGATLVLEIGEHDHRGVYIPPGVAHGFYALTDMTITYLVDHYYNPADELGVAWDDPDLQIVWPTANPELSERDCTNPRRVEIAPELRPT
ncbi:MAG TPA: dTDP-4-dehydrorhamnose 3,5-epimerase [Acidimicrobiia bacterium]|jgi:dTDP-4-dehydrorhamnose 3,5-epimerase|nr:dTDP-4-dehydrorhamnose 3,5-epimerase [Acidimicrobiia bacterium]